MKKLENGALRYEVTPELSPAAVASLRRAVGWEVREEALRKTVGCCYLSVGCFDGEALVGYVEVLSDGVDDAFIRNLLVAPVYQRRGVALGLLRTLLKRLRHDGIKTVNVLFQPELAELYRQAGFRIISGGIIDNDPPGSGKDET